MPDAEPQADPLVPYHDVLARIGRAAREAGREPSAVTLTAVTKTHEAERVLPLLEAGHRDFGENRVQEAAAKWPALRERFEGITLRLIGPLQSNKAAEAVAAFDVIETVDREKIARVLGSEMEKQGRSLPAYVQVNTGDEPQKAGVAPQEAVAFAARCREEHGLNVVGLMCIPPLEAVPAPHFALLRKLAREAGLPELSMGMSGDYEAAVSLGATSVRVGSALFGARPLA
jgi:pyridoxal phosphate enzyme (YggS family)